MPVLEQTAAITYQPLDALNLWEDNYNEGDVGKIVTSIRRFGYRGALRVWQNNQVMGGNHSLKALRILESEHLSEPPYGIRIDKNNRWLVPCVSIADLSESEAIAFAIADNKSAKAAVENEEMLLAFLTRLQLEDDTLLQATGFDTEDMAMFEVLLKDPTIPQSVPQREPELPAPHLIQIYCSQDDIDYFQETLNEWQEREGVTVNIS